MSPTKLRGPITTVADAVITAASSSSSRRALVTGSPRDDAEVSPRGKSVRGLTISAKTPQIRRMNPSSPNASVSETSQVEPYIQFSSCDATVPPEAMTNLSPASMNTYRARPPSSSWLPANRCFRARRINNPSAPAAPSVAAPSCPARPTSAPVSTIRTMASAAPPLIPNISGLPIGLPVIR